MVGRLESTYQWIKRPMSPQAPSASSNAGASKRDFALDLVIEILSATQVGEHDPREIFWECPNISAAIQIRCQPT